MTGPSYLLHLILSPLPTPCLMPPHKSSFSVCLFPPSIETERAKRTKASCALWKHLVLCKRLRQGRSISLISLVVCYAQGAQQQQQKKNLEQMSVLSAFTEGLHVLI